MKIAVLGWGSLIWCPKTLPIRQNWFQDGPIASVEFARQSNDGRMTLVLCDDARPVQLLWALMEISDLNTAVEALAKREGINQKNTTKHIGRWTNTNVNPQNFSNLAQWAESRGIGGVVWTALSCKFDGKEQKPSVEEVLAYLERLVAPQRCLAEEYVRKAPRQIDTDYRRAIEAHLNWTFLED